MSQQNPYRVGESPSQQNERIRQQQRIQVEQNLAKLNEIWPFTREKLTDAVNAKLKIGWSGCVLQQDDEVPLLNLEYRIFNSFNKQGYSPMKMYSSYLHVSTDFYLSTLSYKQYLGEILIFPYTFFDIGIGRGVSVKNRNNQLGILYKIGAEIWNLNAFSVFAAAGGYIDTRHQILYEFGLNFQLFRS